MIYCTKCGAPIDGGTKFCPSCGNAAPADTAPSQPNMADASNNKAMGILAYLGILVLVPIFAAKESPFARYHANQGLILALAEVAYGIVYSIIVSIFTAIMLRTGAWGLLGVVTTIFGLLWFVFVALAVIGIINAANGRRKPLPVIGKFTLLK